MRKAVQFELWKDCSNACQFCFNRSLIKKSSTDDKIERIQFVKNFIQSNSIQDYNIVGLIGGEFFDTQLSTSDVYENFCSLIELLSQKLENGTIDQVWLATALMYESLDYLKAVLDIFLTHNCIDKVLICTSYDTRGRFFANKEQIWKNNMKIIKSMFPQIKLHTEMIVTQDLVDKVINDDFDIVSFQKQYDTHIDFLEPNCGFKFQNKQEHMKVLPWFYPTRKSFMDFMKKLSSVSSIINDEFLSANTRSHTLFMQDEYSLSKFDNRSLKQTTLPCDIPNKNGYSDSDVEMRKDVEEFLENI